MSAVASASTGAGADSLGGSTGSGSSSQEKGAKMTSKQKGRETKEARP